MARDNTVITVQLEASAGNVDAVFTLTANNAKKMGKAIGDALALDNKNTLKSLDSVNQSLLSIKTNAVSVRNALKAMGDFPFKQTNNNIASIVKQLQILETQAIATAKALRDVKLNTGGGRGSSSSAVSELKNQTKTVTEATTQMANNVERAMSKVNASTVKNSLNSAQALSSLGRTFGQTSEGFERVAKTLLSSSGALGNVTFRAKKDAIEYNKVVDSFVNGTKKLSILGDANTASRNAKLKAEAANRIPVGGESGYRFAETGTSKMNIAALQTMTGRPTQIPESIFGQQGKKSGQNFSTEFINSLKSLDAKVAEVAKNSSNRFSRIFTANFFADILYHSLSRMVTGLVNAAEETVKYAARTEELGVALSSLARVNNISTETITEQEVAIKRLNITTQDTRETLARFINVGFDINKASPLARVAQDLAVIGNLSTSEELDKLTVAIQTLQSRNLRTAGVFITVDEVLDKLSATTGRARDSFTTLEKQEAVLNAVLEYGSKVAGTYDAAMGTVSKRMRSLERNFREAQNAIGEAFIPALGLAVDGTTALLQVVAKYPNLFKGAIYTVGLFATSLILLKTQVISGLFTGFSTAVDGFKATLNTALGTNFTTVQTERNALALQEAHLNELNLTLENLKLDTKIAQLTTEAELVVGKEAEIILLERDLLIESQITNQKRLQLAQEVKARGGATVTTAAASTASALGTIGLIAAGTVALYQAIQFAVDYANAPEKVTNLDLSAATKNAADLNNLIEYRNDLLKITSGESQNENENLAKTFEIYSELDPVLKARLTTELGIVDASTNRLDLATKELSVLQEQQSILEETKKAKITEGTSNLEAAIKNYTAAKELTTFFDKTLNYSNEAVKNGNSKSYFNQPLAGSANIALGGLNLIAQTAASYLPGQTTYARIADNDEKIAARNFDYFKEKAAEAHKTLEEAQAQIVSTASDLQKLAKTYGETNVDKFVLSQYKVSDAFRDSVLNGTDFVGTMTEQEKTARALIDALDALASKQSRVAVKASSTDLYGRLSTLGGSFNQERERFIKAAEKDIEQRERLAVQQNPNNAGKYLRVDESGKYITGAERFTEESRKIVEGAKNIFDSGVVAKESFDQFKKDIESAVTSDFIQKFANDLNKGTITVNDVVNKVEDVRKQAIADSETYKNAISDEDKTKLKNAQGTEKLINSMKNYALQAEISKTVTEGLELSYYGMSKALLDANKAYNDFFSTSPKFIGDDALAKRKSKITELGTKFEDLAGGLGLDPNIVAFSKTIVSDQDLQIQEDYFKNLVRQLEPTQKAKDIRDQIKDLEVEASNVGLRAAEKELELAQARVNLDKTRDYNSELKIIEAQTSLVEAQNKTKDFDNKALAKLERQVKLEEGVLAFRQEQRDIENEIAVLKITSTLPAINAQLLIEQNILSTIKDRRKEEQQLTADIAVEINKRNRYSLASPGERARIGAGVFLDAQRSERSAQEELVRQQYQNALDAGDTSAFKDNPLIKEAVKQAEALAEIDKKGGLQAIKTDKTNDILTETQGLIKATTSAVNDLGTSVTSSVKEVKMSLDDKLDKALASSRGDAFAGLGGNLSGLATSNLKPTGNLGSALDSLVKRRKLGATPQQIAALFGFESAGTYSTSKYGGDNNKYLGLFQAGPSEQRDFGVSPGQSYEEAVLAFEKFIDRRFKKAGVPLEGANLEQLYASILTGSPANYLGKQDSNKTTVRSGVADMLKNHLPVAARKFFGGVRGSTSDVIKAIKPNTTVTPQKVIDDLVSIEAQAETEFLKFLNVAEDNKKAEVHRIRMSRAHEVSMLEFNRAYTDFLRQREENTGVIGDARRRTKEGITSQTELDLLNPNSGAYKDVVSDFTESQAQERISRKKKFIELQQLENDEIGRQLDMMGRVRENFRNNNIETKHSLEQQEFELELRKKARIEGGLYLDNILRQEILARDENREAIEAEIDALRRYQQYQGTDQQKTDFEREALRDRTKAHNDTLDEITRSEIRVANSREGLEVRLAARIQQIREDQAGEYERNLIRQVELEEEYRRKSDPYNSDLFRNGALENITGRMKTQTELMTDLFNDSFNGISDGFGGLIDKMTSKMGVFGGAVGNLLKGVFNNILGNLQKNVLDVLSPKNPTQPSTGSTKDAGSLVQDTLAPSLGGMANANNYAANSVIQLANDAGMAAQALIGIAGQVGTTVGGIQGALSGGGTGGNRASAIPGITASGISGIGSITSGSFQSIQNPFGGTVPNLNSGVFTSTPPFVPASATVSGSGAGAGPVGSVVKASGGIGALVKGLGLKSAGISLLAGLPQLGAGLGGMLGGQSVIGQGLGQLGGLIGGGVGLGVIGSIAGSTGLGGIFGSGGALSAFGGLSAATLGIGAAVAGAFLIGSYLFGRAKRRKEEKKKVTELSSDARKQLEELLKSVRTDKIDGAEAVSRAEEIRQQYVEQIATLKTSPGKKQAQQQLQSMDGLIAQIKSAARGQEKRRETFESIVPTYATGGQADTQLVRVSRGETLYSPETIPYMKEAFRSAGIPGLSGKSYYTKGKFGKVTIPGRFDGKDDILMSVPVGTVIATPRHEEKIRARGYNSGGQVGYVAAPAAQSVTVSAPPVNVVVVVSEEEANKIAGRIPDSIIVNKTINHVKKTGMNGLAGVVAKELTGY